MILKHCPRTQQCCSPTGGFANLRCFPHPCLPVLEEEFHCSQSQCSREAPRKGQSSTRMWCPWTPQLLLPKHRCLPPDQCPGQPSLFPCSVRVLSQKFGNIFPIVLGWKCFCNAHIIKICKKQDKSLIMHLVLDNTATNSIQKHGVKTNPSAVVLPKISFPVFSRSQTPRGKQPFIPMHFTKLNTWL